jgi:hypothetical protein
MNNPGSGPHYPNHRHSGMATTIKQCRLLIRPKSAR